VEPQPGRQRHPAHGPAPRGDAVHRRRPARGRPLRGDAAEPARGLADLPQHGARGLDAARGELERDEALARRFFARVRVLQYGGAALGQAVGDRIQAVAAATVGEADQLRQRLRRDGDRADRLQRALAQRPHGADRPADPGHVGPPRARKRASWSSG
jgi:hypothetical protein